MFIGFIIKKIEQKSKNAEVRLAVKLKEMEELKMTALQSQMNPHFLFNSLNSINNFVINLMSNIEEIRSLSSSYAVWLIIMPLISSFCFQFDGIFIGVSQTKELRNAMIFSVFSYLVISIFLTGLMGNTGVWISLCIFMILRALSLYYYMNRIYLKFNK